MIPGKTYTPDDILQIARRRKWLIIVPFVLVATGTAVVANFLPNRYRSQTLLLVVPQRVPESYVRSTVTTRIEDRLQSMSQQILSRTRLERIIQDFHLYPEERKGGIMEEVVEQMRRDIDLQIVKGDAFRLSYSSSDPRMAMAVTERLASIFIEENLREREVLAEGTNQFLEAQLDEARRRLDEHDKRLEEYRKLYAGELPSQLQSNLQVIQNAQMQMQALLESSARARDRRLVLERLIADATAPENLPAPLPAAEAVEAAAARQSTAKQLEEARSTMRSLELRYQPEHPSVVRMERFVRELEKKAEAEALEQPLSPAVAPPTPAELARRSRIAELREEMQRVNTELAHKESEEKRIRSVSAEYQRRVEAAPGRESQLSALMRDYDTLSQMYRSMLGKREDSKVSANLERRQIGEQFKILDPARLPQLPYSPNRVQVDLLGALAGLAFGLALVALLEYRNSSFRTDEDVVNCLRLPVLALVPVMVTRAERRAYVRRRLLVATAVGTSFVAAVGGAVWFVAPAVATPYVAKASDVAKPYVAKVSDLVRSVAP